MKPNEWILSLDTGTSSKTIWAVMMGAVTGKELPFRFDVPHDPDDFGRCYRLLQNFPGWLTRLNEVAIAFPKWGPMVRNWGKLTEMYKKHPEGRRWAPEMYKFMRKLEDEGLEERRLGEK